MEELYIKALSENLGGSIKYARYAYEFLKDYFESHPIESLEIVSGRDFQEFAQDMSDINDFYYSAYYYLYS